VPNFLHKDKEDESAGERSWRRERDWGTPGPGLT